MAAVELEPLIQQKKPLSAALAVVIVLIILLPSVILSMVLYLWVSGFMGPPMDGGVDGTTPTIALGSATVSKSETLDGTTSSWANITWTVVGVSRADIKWDDIDLTVTKNGMTTSGTVGRVYTGSYVKAGHTVYANVTGINSGDKIDITLVYTPTGGMVGTSYAIVT